jgi:hypothetical protein
MHRPNEDFALSSLYRYLYLGLLANVSQDTAINVEHVTIYGI